MTNKLLTSDYPAGRSGMKRLKMLAVAGAAVVAMGSAMSASALDVLGPTEVPKAINWSTTGGYQFVSNGGGSERETIDFQTAGVHTIQATTLTVTVVDLATNAERTVVADTSDPFQGETFTFSPMSLNEATVPATGNTGNVDFVGNYNGVFGTKYVGSSFISADVYSTTAPRPYLTAANAVAFLDCCDSTDQQNIVYGTPSSAGAWLQLNDGSVVNVEQLMATKGKSLGDLNSSLNNAGTPTCPILSDIRGDCTPGTTSMSGSFSIPLDIPEPEVSCTSQVFSGDSSADPGDAFLKTLNITSENLNANGCTGIDFTETVSCSGADFSLTIDTPAPAGCTVTETAVGSGVYNFVCNNKQLTGAVPSMSIPFNVSFQGADGSCSATLTALTCGAITGTTAGCADSLSRQPPVEIVPAISPMGLTAALIGLPLIGGFVARRRNRKG